MNEIIIYVLWSFLLFLIVAILWMLSDYFGFKKISKFMGKVLDAVSNGFP